MDVSMLFLFQNIFVVTFLFWAISTGGKLSFKLRKWKNNLELFECGFLSSIKYNIHFNFNFIIIVWLLIIYDVEFFFVIPYLFNWTYMAPQSFWIYVFFLSIVIVTLLQRIRFDLVAAVPVPNRATQCLLLSFLPRPGAW